MLSIKNIETWYDLIRALHGISFEIKEGMIVVASGAATARAKPPRSKPLCVCWMMISRKRNDRVHGQKN